MNHTRLVGVLALLALAAALFVALPGGRPASGQQTADISLQPGWNLVSLPLVPTDPAPAAVLTSIAGKFNSAWAYQTASSQAGAAAAAAAWLSYDPSVPPFLNTLAAIDVSMGFWLNMKEAATLSLSGSEPTGANISISPGWNFIGYPAGEAKPIADVMGSLAYNSVWAYQPGQASSWQSYDPNVPPFLNTLQQFEPGRGYALNASAAGALTIANVEAPSSFDVIEEALANGDIHEETAILYKTFALFRDDRLPPQYRGNPLTDEDSFMVEIQSAYEDLSPEAKATIDPFLLPPTAPGSWHEQRYAASSQAVAHSQAQPTPSPVPCFGDLDQCWHTVDTANGKVRVWWQERFPEDKAAAEQIADAVGGAIWDKLAQLMGREPPSDGQFADEENGYGPRLDIYLVAEVAAVGQTVPYHVTFNRQPCLTTPVFLLIRRPAVDAPPVVAHELMHAFQFAFEAVNDCKGLTWLSESTATWAMDYVYPQANKEHGYAEGYLADLGESLMAKGDRHEYGSYLFFQFATRKFGDQLVRQTWAGLQQDNVTFSLQQALPGGYRAVWAEFARDAWNREPVAQFQEWDGLELGASPRKLEAEDPSSTEPGIIEVTLEGQTKRNFEPGASEVYWLSAQYFHFQVTDPEVRFIEAKNPYHPNVPAAAAVQALIRLEGGSWTVEDWTGDKSHTFCLDDDDEKLAELVVIVSNGATFVNSTRFDAFANPLLIAKDSCGKKWTGQASHTTVLNDTPGQRQQKSVSASGLVFEEDEQAGAAAGGTRVFRLTSGSVTVSVYTETYDEFGMPVICVVGGSTELGPGEGQITVTTAEDGTETYRAQGNSAQGVTLEGNCPGSGNQAVGTWLDTGPARPLPDDDVVAGTYEPNAKERFEWNLSRE
ncbi:MAG: hypothetical protein HYY03_06875 [Chloroflexi bacterium]|nr:hypothetical protein [Chloroflexota bacterium]